MGPGHSLRELSQILWDIPTSKLEGDYFHSLLYHDVKYLGRVPLTYGVDTICTKTTPNGHPGKLGLLPPAGWELSTDESALRLGSKDMHGLIRFWINVGWHVA